MPPDTPWPGIAFALTLTISGITIIAAIVRAVRPWFRSPVAGSIEVARFNLEASNQVIDGLQAQLALIGADRTQDRSRIGTLEGMLNTDWQDRAKTYRDIVELQDEVRQLTRERDSALARLADAERAARSAEPPGVTG